MKVGILYSSSKEHPELLPDFIDGLKSSLKNNQLTASVETLMESIGFGGMEKEVYEKAEKLLVLNGVDILVAYIDLRVLNLIEPLVYSKNKLLIVINAGANYPEDKIPQPNIIFLTLRHSFLCWLTGRVAGSYNQGPAAVATSLYDAGYLHMAGISRGYSSRGGGVRFNYINKSKYDDSFEISQLREFLSNEKEIKQVLAVFDSRPAAYFYEQLNKLEDKNNLELFVSPMMLEQTALINNYPFLIEGYSPYDPLQPNDTNHLYRNYYKEETKREASIFSLQGWELGLVLKQIDANIKELQDGAAIREGLLDITIESPRGQLKLDLETNYFTGPVFHVKKDKDNDKVEFKPEEKEAEWAEFLLNPVEGPSSGWTNTYLCY